MIDFSLIKVIPAGDSHYDFVYRLKKEVYGGYITQIWGWDEDLQKEFFTGEWRRHKPDVILYENQPIGTYCCTKNEDSYHLERFYILPDYQNKGIGTYILKGILDTADKAGLPVRLMWLSINPAASLYTRMGFRVTGKMEIEGKQERFVLAERQPLKREQGQNKKKYKAVIFDLFGTLVDNFPESEGNAVLKRAAAALVVSPEDYISQWAADYKDRMTGVYPDFQACVRNICQRLGAQPTKEQTEAAAGIRADMTQREVMSYREGAFKVLTYLKANGYKTGLVSNASMETTRVWPKTTLAPFIDTPVFSCLEGVMKPDPRIFQIALERLAVSPQECLYVADGMNRELSTASKLGLHAVLVKSPHDSEYEYDREDWRGTTILSLKEIKDLL